MSSARRPKTGYYEEAIGQVRQGNIFREVPRSIAFPPDAVAVEDGNRFFISGPFDHGLAILVSPSCSFAAQGVESGYSHPYRQMAPVITLEHLVDQGAIKTTAVEQLREFDGLRNYLYLPGDSTFDIPESCALLYASAAIHSAYLTDDVRVAQLTSEAEVHLKRQLAAHSSGSLFSHDAFEPDERN